MQLSTSDSSPASSTTLALTTGSTAYGIWSTC